MKPLPYPREVIGPVLTKIEPWAGPILAWALLIVMLVALVLCLWELGKTANLVRKIRRRDAARNRSGFDSA